MKSLRATRTSGTTNVDRHSVSDVAGMTCGVLFVARDRYSHDDDDDDDDGTISRHRSTAADRGKTSTMSDRAPAWCRVGGGRSCLV